MKIQIKKVNAVARAQIGATERNGPFVRMKYRQPANHTQRQYANGMKSAQTAKRQKCFDGARYCEREIDTHSTHNIFHNKQQQQ